MTSAAYWIDGRRSDAGAFYAVACDPSRSVVVEACAGAGKTWMLVSRIVRALLDGAAPQEILAITFTRKAAAEMRERLMDWLRDFAAADAPARIEALTQRGLDRAQAEALQQRLGGLRLQVLQSGRMVGVHTFHGWFWQLLRTAPMDLLAELGLSPEMQLLEDSAEIVPEAWRRFMQAVAREPGLLDDYTALVAELGRHSARAWLLAALERRGEIELADAAGVLDACLPAAADWAPQWSHLQSAVEALNEPAVQDALRRLVRDWHGHKNKLPAQAARQIEAALFEADPEHACSMIEAALLTKAGEVQARLPEHDVLDLVVDTLQAIRECRRQQQAHELHARMARLTRVFLRAYGEIKRARGLADMTDLERAALHLLRDATLSGWVQERLDARVRHLLIDEFQDTSPLQWQGLQAWLAGYAGAGGGASGQRGLSVFIVGDPKQSIYRFRRAEPRVFRAAQAFVTEALDGAHLACDHTRRNAQPVIDCLNGVFMACEAEGDYAGFRPHTTASEAPGELRVLPTIEREARQARDADAPWRDSLTEPRVLAEEVPRQKEGRQTAAAIAELLARGWQPGDIFVLARRRESLRWVAEALRERGIAHAAPEEQALLDSVVARDLLALLEVLASPASDLALAQALRSPIFGAADDDLMRLAVHTRRGRDMNWWQALHDLAREGDAPGPLRRASALLRNWDAAQHVLPPHDLLDRIVTEGDLRARIAAATPAAHRQAALAQLDGMLAQALALDAGRYSTIYNFVRALKRRTLTLPVPREAHAVQLLTVHGAKGLEARAVFIVDADPGRSRTESYTLLIDWPVESPYPVTCAFVRSEAAPPPSLRAAIAAERTERQREELNALYVAMTRARELLVFSRNEPYQRGGTPSWWQRAEPVWSARGVEAWCPDAAAAAAPPVPVDDAIELRTLPAPLAYAAVEPDGRGAAGAGRDDEPADASQARIGEALHLALQGITETGAASPRETGHWPPAESLIERAVERAAARFGLDPAARDRVHDAVGRVLRSPAVAPLLRAAPGGWAGNEVELVFEGQLLRIDRLVQRPAGGGGDEWWVLDYKLDTRPDEDEAYRSQLARYARAVAALQPGAVVRAAFVTAQGRLIETDPGGA